MATLHRKPRSPAVAIPAAAPFDVRVMNGVASVIFAVAVVALLAAVVKWATRTPMFTLQAITLDAALHRTNLASVRANALPRLAGNFFSIDLERSRSAFEQVPWVRRAQVRRVWPNRLAVTLEEHEPAALWQGDDRRNERLVNTRGEVFEANVGDVEDLELPTLAGADAQSPRMLAMLQRLTLAFAPLQWPVTTLRLSARGSWKAELGGSGGVLEIGRGGDDEVASRVERFARTVGDVASRFGSARAVVTADLRHPDGYALRLAGVSTAASGVGR